MLSERLKRLLLLGAIVLSAVVIVGAFVVGGRAYWSQQSVGFDYMQDQYSLSWVSSEDVPPAPTAAYLEDIARKRTPFLKDVLHSSKAAAPTSVVPTVTGNLLLQARKNLRPRQSVGQAHLPFMRTLKALHYFLEGPLLPFYNSRSHVPMSERSQLELIVTHDFAPIRFDATFLWPEMTPPQFLAALLRNFTVPREDSAVMKNFFLQHELHCQGQRWTMWDSGRVYAADSPIMVFAGTPSEEMDTSAIAPRLVSAVICPDKKHCQVLLRMAGQLVAYDSESEITTPIPDTSVFLASHRKHLEAMILRVDNVR